MTVSSMVTPPTSNHHHTCNQEQVGHQLGEDHAQSDEGNCGGDAPTTEDPAG